MSTCAGIVVFKFPRFLFGDFHDALLRERHSLQSYGGVLESLSYDVSIGRLFKAKLNQQIHTIL